MVESQCFFFEDAVRQAKFAESFDVQHRSTELLLTILMTCIWSITAYHYYHMEYTVTSACLTALSIVAVAFQLHLTLYVLHPGFSASEHAKAHVYLGHLTGCMMAVVLTDALHSVPFTSSITVHTVHGWATAFVGFRLSARCWLHTIIFLCYVIMRLQHPGNVADTSLFRVICNICKLLACNAVLPMVVNALYEARQRAEYVEATKSPEAIKPFWSFVLSCVS